MRVVPVGVGLDGVDVGLGDFVGGDAVGAHTEFDGGLLDEGWGDGEDAGAVLQVERGGADEGLEGGVDHGDGGGAGAGLAGEDAGGHGDGARAVEVVGGDPDEVDLAHQLRLQGEVEGFGGGVLHAAEAGSAGGAHDGVYGADVVEHGADAVGVLEVDAEGAVAGGGEDLVAFGA